jgi:hypothetical protein
MGFFSSLWGKNRENGKNTQNNTPTVQQPRMTEAQRHDAFVQSLRENTANGKYGPVPTQSTARKAATGSSEDGGRDRGDDPGAPGSQGRESGLKFGTSKSVSASQGSGKGRVSIQRLEQYGSGRSPGGIAHAAHLAYGKHPQHLAAGAVKTACLAPEQKTEFAPAAPAAGHKPGSFWVPHSFLECSQHTEKRVRTGSKPRCLIPAQRPHSGPARWAWQCTDLPGRRPRWAAC